MYILYNYVRFPNSQNILNNRILCHISFKFRNFQIVCSNGGNVAFRVPSQFLIIYVVLVVPLRFAINTCTLMSPEEDLRRSGLLILGYFHMTASEVRV